MISRKAAGSTPRPSARATDSPRPSISASSQALRTSFIRVAAPGSSASVTVRAPTASKTGAQRSRASAGPAAITISLPCSAGAFVPSTGASTIGTPTSAARATSRSVASRPTVLICAQTAPSGNSRSPATASTAAPSASIVTTTSAPATASSGVSATATPSAVSGSARSRLRFHALTSRPAAARLRAMGAPMMPVPRTATFTRLVPQDGADAAERPQGVVMADADHVGGLLDGLLDRLLDDVLDRHRGGALRHLLGRRVEQVGGGIADTGGRHSGADQQDLHARLVERREHLREPRRAAASAADPLRHAVERLALAAARELGDLLARAGAHGVQAGVLHVAGDAADEPLLQVRVQLGLEVPDRLLGPADQQPVEAAQLEEVKGRVGRMAEMVLDLLVDAALVARLRPAALVVLAVDR